MATVNLTNSISSARFNEGMPVDFGKTALGSLDKKITTKEAWGLLSDIRAKLTTADGKVKSGYLSLERAGENGAFTISNRSRLGASGSKHEAAALIRQLVDIAYGEAASHTRDGLLQNIDTYLTGKGDKFGTKSFVKLINQLEHATGGQALSEKKADAGSLVFGGYHGLRQQYVERVGAQNLSNPADPPRTLREQAELMKPGDTIGLSGGLSGGINVGHGFKLPAILGAGVEAGVQGLGTNSRTLTRTEDGFVLTQMKFKGLGASVGVHGEAVIELAGSEAAGNVGRVKEEKFTFATAEDAARFLSDGRGALDKASGPVPTKGQYVEHEPEKRFAVRTETEVRSAVLSRAQPIKPVGGSILHQKINTESTLFKSEDGTRVAHRIYTNVHEKNSLEATLGQAGLEHGLKVVANHGLKILSKIAPVSVASSRVNSNVKLEMRQTTPADGKGGTLASKFSPELRLGIDAHIVAACRDRQAVAGLAEIEFNRTLTLMKAANNDAAPPGAFDLSDDAQAALRDTVHRGFQYIHDKVGGLVNPAERARSAVQPTVIQGASVSNKSVDVNLLGSGGSIGSSSGGMVTFRLPFNNGDPGAPTRVSGQVEMGYTSRSAKQFNISVGLSTEKLPSPIELEASAKLSGSSTTEFFTVTDRIGAPPNYV